jgi:hypothetical protein
MRVGDEPLGVAQSLDELMKVYLGHIHIIFINDDAGLASMIRSGNRSKVRRGPHHLEIVAKVSLLACRSQQPVRKNAEDHIGSCSLVVYVVDCGSADKDVGERARRNVRATHDKLHENVSFVFRIQQSRMMTCFRSTFSQQSNTAFKPKHAQ